MVAHGVIALSLAMGILFAVFLQAAVFDASGGRASVPLVRPAILVALTFFYATYVRRTLLPCVRHMSATLAE